jgi:hypothetical protein
MLFNAIVSATVGSPWDDRGYAWVTVGLITHVHNTTVGRGAAEPANVGERGSLWVTVGRRGTSVVRLDMAPNKRIGCASVDQCVLVRLSIRVLIGPHKEAGLR